MSLAINQGLFARKIADHFAVLGLPIDANPKVVRKAYLQIAQRLHPDTCTLTQALDKRLASEFLSKLVNPAYEKLSKPASWSEYQVILVQLSQQLSNETDNLVLTTTEAQELLDTPGNISALYREKVAALAQANYQTMATVPQAIATLSELNLVYLQYLGKVKKVETKETMPQYPGETMATSGATVSPPPPKNTSTSSLDAALWRGEEHLKKKNYAKAVLEFRDALQLDPNCIKAHALMGLSYLSQNQLAMAKVHIKKAYLSKPTDPLVRQAKQALEKVMGSALETQPGAKKGSADKQGGLFGGLFGGKKK
ncbi:MULTISPECIES: J domain-containing protein [Cyanophyceae]|uniref:J domain-containing protein n=1 Tax=Cyanophyceae TaxID=3028117 RepID=UPI000810C66C|nr:MULTISPECIES: J domain-containing protein [Cyanophyceae]ANV89723.1 molecular chaperone DnaJ [Picosynechococcus sp. PCC 8807]QCS49238.1 J domain-containing protein [Picosynechococcus sp. PCC 11901]